MATTATSKAAAATVAAALAPPTVASSSSSSNTSVISAPIKIPLSERFSTQTSTGSADSGVIVTSASQKQLCSVGSLQQQQQQQQTTLLQLQQLPVRSSSGSLSLHGPQPKWQRQQQRQQQQQQQQQQLLLLSQDSGIEQRGGEGASSGAGGGQSNSSSESLGSSSSGGGNEARGTLQVGGSGGVDGSGPGSSRRNAARSRTRAASALELSSVGVGVGVATGGVGALRRIKYKSTNSTQGFDVEDRIEEVDIGDNPDDDDDDDDDDVVDDDEEDDGVAVDVDVDEVDEEDTQSGIIINIGGHVDEVDAEQLQLQAAKVKAEEELPLELAPLTVAAAAAKRKDVRSLGTDGHIYFPLLKINEDPHIDAKLINRKDGLQDTMYYLDEFGSPKLREKFARKQKQRQAKQQKALLKREREEQRKKRNTTVASNLAASGIDTKEQQPPQQVPQKQQQQQQQRQAATKAANNNNNHCDRNRSAISNEEDQADDADADVDGDVVKMRVRSHSHDNHYDAAINSDSNSTFQTARRHSDDRKRSQPDSYADDLGDIVLDDDVDEDVETGAEAGVEAGLERVKTAKLARTQSCVSWTKVVQKFKHILGMKQLIGKLNDLWPEHSVALSIPKEVDRSKEKLEGAWETTGRDGSKITTVVATPGQGTDRVQEVSYTDTKVIGNGSFGVVFQAKLCDTGELVAIKKVLQDRRFKNRELQIMRRLEHCNIVKLLYFFYSSGEKRDEVFLNLVLEYIPETVYKVARQYAKTKQTIPINFIRLYMYQLFRSLAYIHSLGICHRDIKPQNLLLDPETAVLKLCDFGSAKQLLHGEPNVSYICSRYYRAPELIFGAINYTTKIDVWSAGCVLAELLLGQPIFPGDSGVDQLVEVIKVLGTPTREQIREMNPNYTEFKFPQIKSHPWQKVFRIRTPTEAINLVSQLLEYTPSARITPLKACAHPFFDELRMEGNHTLPNGREMPPLFNFTEHELSIQPSLVPQLLPKHLQNAAVRASAGGGSAPAAASGSTSVSSTGSGASADGGAAQSQQQTPAAAAAAAGGAGAGAGAATGATSATSAAAAAAGGGGGGGGGQGNNSSSSNSGTATNAAPTAAATAGNAPQSNAAASGAGGGGGGVAAAATAAGAIATSNAGGANITGSQSNSALNSSAGAAASGNGDGGDASAAGGDGEAGGNGNGSGDNGAAAEADQAAAAASGSTSG
ncbi:hypothetical protein KR093_003111 [Drosophila rubida]|uniref:Protein kinase domain-containing protein n=1 Tax=Drosophila rubida TaxID=30044 RepID=A0AAD4K9H0_9MUSC|nr:hypothetical protein KR093_003111 [Drosophila rubida]